MAKSSEAPNEQTFETAIGRLEGLVEEMEREDLPLERLIVNYEEGIRLVKTCQQKLAEAEKKIEMIQRQAGADPELKAFDPEAKADSPAPARKAGPGPGPRDANLF
jgi:exodeoxyribonuclease VII small subunit